MVGTEHSIERGKVHYKWDNSLEPAIEIEPGDVVHFEAEEVTDGQLKPDSPASALASLDFNRLYPLAGPVFVKGAEPGDVLEVEMLELRPLDWGWAGLIPGLGLLAADFPDPYLRHFDLSNGESTVFADNIRIPLQPFCGTMGVATDEPGQIDVLPPTKGAGNIDTRHLNVGTKVCVTGLECPMAVSLRFNVVKDRTIKPWRYQFQTPPGSLQAKSDTKGYFATTALGPDLMVNAQNAVRDLIDWLAKEHSLSREDAYILCSLAADLKISQIVDQPNWGVSAYLSLAVFKD